VEAPLRWRMLKRENELRGLLHTFAILFGTLVGNVRPC
jgi:hypothetical protein